MDNDEQNIKTYDGGSRRVQFVTNGQMRRLPW